MELCDNISSVLMALIIITFIVLMIGREELDRDHIYKRCVVFFIIIVVFEIFIPSGKTIKRMLIANYITPANVEKAGELTEIAVDKIIEKIINARLEKK